MKEVNTIKYFLLIMLIGVILGLVSFLVHGFLAQNSIYPPRGLLGGAIYAAGYILAIVVINRSLNNGGMNWLRKKKV